MNVGLGTMGGVCYTDRKCTVNQDSGLDTAYTIVHELGHAYEKLQYSLHLHEQFSFIGK